MRISLKCCSLWPIVLWALICILMVGIPLTADATEVTGYPIASVTATASSAHQEDMGPEKTVDGSGLDEMDRHSTEATDMWLSGQESDPWIQFEFDKVYTLSQMWVWNSNQLIERFIGLGVKNAVVEYSTDGTAWTVLEGIAQFSQATSSADYVANTVIEFEGARAKYVRITISTNYGIMPQYGLSEVRFFFYIPIQAANLNPNPWSRSLTSVLQSGRGHRR